MKAWWETHAGFKGNTIINPSIHFNCYELRLIIQIPGQERRQLSIINIVLQPARTYGQIILKAAMR